MLPDHALGIEGVFRIWIIPANTKTYQIIENNIYWEYIENNIIRVFLSGCKLGIWHARKLLQNVFTQWIL